MFTARYWLLLLETVLTSAAAVAVGELTTGDDPKTMLIAIGSGAALTLCKGIAASAVGTPSNPNVVDLHTKVDGSDPE